MFCSLLEYFEVFHLFKSCIHYFPSPLCFPSFISFSYINNAPINDKRYFSVSVCIRGLRRKQVMRATSRATSKRCVCRACSVRAWNAVEVRLAAASARRVRRWSARTPRASRRFTRTQHSTCKPSAINTTSTCARHSFMPTKGYPCVELTSY